MHRLVYDEKADNPSSIVYDRIASNTSRIIGTYLWMRRNVVTGLQIPWILSRPRARTSNSILAVTKSMLLNSQGTERKHSNSAHVLKLDHQKKPPSVTPLFKVAHPDWSHLRPFRSVEHRLPTRSFRSRFLISLMYVERWRE